MKRIGMCPKCSKRWPMELMISSGYQCPVCGHQLKTGSDICVLSSTGKYLTPCTRERAKQEVTLQRAEWKEENILHLLSDIPKRDRYRSSVFQRDRNICLWCGKAAESLDHIVPRSHGGPFVPENLMATCTPCNTHRGNRSVEEYMNVLISAGQAPPSPALLMERLQMALEVMK